MWLGSSDGRCSQGKREALGSSPGRATIVSSPLILFSGQYGFTARAASIKTCMSRCSEQIRGRI